MTPAPRTCRGRTRALQFNSTYLLYGVQLDARTSVPDADEVVQPRADDAGVGADQGGHVAAVTIHMADATSCEDVPQTDGAVLPPTGQDHGLQDGLDEMVTQQQVWTYTQHTHTQHTTHTHTHTQENASPPNIHL